MEREKGEMIFTAQVWRGRKIAIPRTVAKGLGIFEGGWGKCQIFLEQDGPIDNTIRRLLLRASSSKIRGVLEAISIGSVWGSDWCLTTPKLTSFAV